MIDWRLVINLFFLLLLLISARRAWVDRASDDELKRRAARKQLTITAVLGVATVAFFAVIYVWLPLNAAKHRNVLQWVWFALLANTVLVNIFDKKPKSRSTRHFGGYTR